jgi:hypothetical protein
MLCNHSFNCDVTPLHLRRAWRLLGRQPGILLAETKPRLVMSLLASAEVACIYDPSYVVIRRFVGDIIPPAHIGTPQDPPRSAFTRHKKAYTRSFKSASCPELEQSETSIYSLIIVGKQPHCPGFTFHAKADMHGSSRAMLTRTVRNSLLTTHDGFC